MTRDAWIGSLLDNLHFENLGANLTGSQRFPGFVEVSHEKLATLRPRWSCWSRTAIRRASSRSSTS